MSANERRPGWDTGATVEHGTGYQQDGTPAGGAL